MGVNDEEQCNEGGAAGDNNNDDRQGNGSKSFGVWGRGRFHKDRRQRRVGEACQWVRYTPLSHLGNCLLSDPELCRAMLSMLGTWDGDHGARAAACGNAGNGDPLRNNNAATAAIASEADNVGQENNNRGGDDGDDNMNNDKWGRGT